MFWPIVGGAILLLLIVFVLFEFFSEADTEEDETIPEIVPSECCQSEAKDVSSSNECCQSKKKEATPQRCCDPAPVTPSSCCSNSDINPVDVAVVVADVLDVATEAACESNACENSCNEEKLPLPDCAPTPCEAIDGSRYAPETPPASENHQPAEVSNSFSYDPPAQDCSTSSCHTSTPEPATNHSASSCSTHDSSGHSSGSSDYSSGSDHSYSSDHSSSGSDYSSGSDCGSSDCGCGGDW